MTIFRSKFLAFALLGLASCGNAPSSEPERPVEKAVKAADVHPGLDAMILAPEGEKAFEDLVRRQPDAETLRLLLQEAGFETLADAPVGCWMMQRGAMRGVLVGGIAVTVTQCPDRPPQIISFPLAPF
jgi:hypothetical protein